MTARPLTAKSVQLRVITAFALAALSASGSAFSNDAPLTKLDFALILSQLDAIDRVVARNAARTPDSLDRYAFDYPRLTADIDVIRQGIKAYQSPTRAQPRNPPELTGHHILQRERSP